jgi:hypothetical protein
MVYFSLFWYIVSRKIWHSCTTFWSYSHYFWKDHFRNLISHFFVTKKKQKQGLIGPRSKGRKICQPGMSH